LRIAAPMMTSCALPAAWTARIALDPIRWIALEPIRWAELITPDGRPLFEFHSADLPGVE